MLIPLIAIFTMAIVAITIWLVLKGPMPIMATLVDNLSDRPCLNHQVSSDTAANPIAIAQYAFAFTKAFLLRGDHSCFHTQGAPPEFYAKPSKYYLHQVDACRPKSTPVFNFIFTIFASPIKP